ncbi:hypothetical protein [Rhodanobacter sp. A1T4]|uniref:hypothetical protein n=1 Tax=Rhodanobacter sp. A1T4 TaxID=2723087 RepID=UPI001616891D|nr:hypothetical protein [Rhodanobacter sp. A1T4]MBB6249450.1 hypothetical protein [Rhodanobacter sp. A1T4]
MALTLQPSARTTPRIRTELKAEDSLWSDSTQAHRYGVTAPAARHWRERDSTGGRSPCPHTLRCTLTEVQEAVAMPPMADETKRRYLFVATPEAIRRAYPSIYVTEHRHAAMPASRTPFDNADSAHRRVFRTGACLRRIVVQHTPEPTSETPSNDATASTGICPRGAMMNASSVRVNPEPAHAHDTLDLADPLATPCPR